MQTRVLIGQAEIELNEVSSITGSMEDKQLLHKVGVRYKYLGWSSVRAKSRLHDIITQT